MPQCFGGVTHYVPPEDEDRHQHAISHFAAGYASDTYFQGEVDAGSIIPADTLEELAEKTGVPFDAFNATVERYNELAHGGEDADFGKVPTHLFPVENPPYYAAPSTPTKTPCPASTWPATPWAGASWWTTPSSWPAQATPWR